jgi:hypothetical protein
VRPLRLDDFDPEDEHALLFKYFVQITSITGDMTEHYRRGTLTDRVKIDFELTLRRWLIALPPNLRLHHPDTLALTEYDFKIRQLHVLYFTALIILFRHEKRDQPPSPVSLLAASFVSGIFQEHLEREDLCHLSVTNIFYLMVTALLQISYQRFPSLAVHQDQEIEIIKLSLVELKKRYPSAIGAERVINQVMKHSTMLPEIAALEHAMALTFDQKEFFAPFGPALCKKWSLVFDTQSTTAITVDGVTLQPTVSSSVADLVGQSALLRDINHQSEYGATRHISNDAIASNVNDPSLFDIDEAILPIEANLDSVGRWWWADWMPEADLDFLAQSL